MAKVDKVTRDIVKSLSGWREVAKYQGSNGRSIHTVETDGFTFKCTCQAFRIRKQECKHIDRAQAPPGTQKFEYERIP